MSSLGWIKQTVQMWVAIVEIIFSTGVLILIFGFIDSGVNFRTELTGIPTYVNERAYGGQDADSVMSPLTTKPL